MAPFVWHSGDVVGNPPPPPPPPITPTQWSANSNISYLEIMKSSTICNNSFCSLWIGQFIKLKFAYLYQYPNQNCTLLIPWGEIICKICVIQFMELLYANGHKILPCSSEYKFSSWEETYEFLIWGVNCPFTLLLIRMNFWEQGHCFYILSICLCGQH